MNSLEEKTAREIRPAIVESRPITFTASGGVPGEKVCNCCGVSGETIRNCLDRENGDFEALLESTGAGSGCGSCLGDVHKIFVRFQAERRAEREGQLLLPFIGDAADTPSKD